MTSTMQSSLSKLKVRPSSTPNPEQDPAPPQAPRLSVAIRKVQSAAERIHPARWSIDFSRSGFRFKKDDDGTEPLLQSAVCNGESGIKHVILAKFDHFLDLDLKTRKRIYNILIDNIAAPACSCRKCAIRPFTKQSTAIFTAEEGLIRPPRSYCVAPVFSLLLANKQINQEVLPLIYAKIHALLIFKEPVPHFFHTLRSTVQMSDRPAFQKFVTTFTIEMPIDAVRPKGADSQLDWRIKTLSKETFRVYRFLGKCEALKTVVVRINVEHFSHSWFQVKNSDHFAFTWLHPFLDLVEEKGTKVTVEFRLPYMKLWWEAKYQKMWVTAWNAGLRDGGFAGKGEMIKLVFRDDQSGVPFVG